MATPRKHWFKVADSIKREQLSNDELATAIRLMAELNMRWARDGLSAEESCSAVLGQGDLIECTGSGSLVRARRIINALAARLSLTVDAQGANTLIEWPKWAEFQGLYTLEPGKSRAKASLESPPPPPLPLPPPLTKDKDKESGASRPRVSGRKRSTPCPDELDSEARGRILSWASEQSPPIPTGRLGDAWETFRDWAIGGDHRRVDWVATFRRSLRDGWSLPNTGNDGESPAQAKQRRSREAAVKSLDYRPPEWTPDKTPSISAGGES